MFLRVTVILLLIFACESMEAQHPAVSPTLSDSTITAIAKLPARYLETVSSKAGNLEKKLDKASDKALSQLQKQEAKMKRKLQKIDSSAANSIFADAANQYKELTNRIKNSKQLSQYIPGFDTLSTSLKFIQQHPQLLSGAKEVKEKLESVTSKIKELEGQFQKAGEIKRFLRERRQFLKEQLSKFGFAKQLRKISKQGYYYSQQISEYKSIINEPGKAEKKALELLSKTKLFKDFMRKNSLFASMFGISGSSGDMSSAPGNMSGLQTRVQVNNILQQQLASGGPNVQQQLRQNMQSAQAQVQQLKDKFSQLGGGEDEMPDFKVKNQKTKSFLKRLEFGSNLQTQKANNYFVTTSDIGLSIGYKLNDKSIIGIGASYKLGLGNGWQRIRLSNEGVGIRSFIDWRLKGSFFVSGGYEQNYRASFSRIEQLRNINKWASSGLLGISKKYSISKKYKGTTQLLWDFMSYRQVPATQPIVFRFGFSLK